VFGFASIFDHSLFGRLPARVVTVLRIVLHRQNGASDDNIDHWRPPPDMVIAAIDHNFRKIKFNPMQFLGVFAIFE
jgi:hypothetical protein